MSDQPTATRDLDSSDLAATVTREFGTSTHPNSSTASGTRYLLGDEIARGGMGVVYRASDTAFGREIAIKVLQDKYNPTSAASRRFADEAKITGQLQHPAIPPVHDLGTLPDGRPFLAMKLIKGDTLDELLKLRTDLTADRGRLLAVFEAVCQAVAYAHAHKVIHRDLKPANVMVGNFGEVQVMDWGLAKLIRIPDCGLRNQETDTDPEETTDWFSNPHSEIRIPHFEVTQAGAVLGTPAFMPPEQAIGAIDQIDERSDVFGLGAILCAILTGKPPFVGATSESTRQLSAQGKVSDAFARLDSCGAEPEFVSLCKRCLESSKDDRPADASEVARAVAAFRTAAEERARRAELDKVKAEGARLAAELRVQAERQQAEEQRKRRKVQLALAAAVAVLLVGGGAVAWWQDRQARDREGERALTADRERQGAETALIQAETALQSGDLVAADAALVQARNRVGEASPADLQDRLATAARDWDVAVELERVAEQDWEIMAAGTSLAGRFYGKELYPRVLAVYGVNPADPVAAAAVVQGSRVRWALTTGLAEWFRAEPERQGLREVLDRIDPDPVRIEFRAAVVAKDNTKIQEMAGRMDGTAVPPWFAVLVGRHKAVPVADALRVLRATWQVYPADYFLAYAMGNRVLKQGPDRLEEAVGWGRIEVALRPRSSSAYNNLGYLLERNGDSAGAEACFRKALELDPSHALVHNNLGWVYDQNGNRVQAEAAYRKAIELDPKLAHPYRNLARSLSIRGDLAGAEPLARKALELDPKFPEAHSTLGWIHNAKGETVAAEQLYRKALELDPNNSDAYRLLGALRDDLKDWVGAETLYRKASELDARNAVAISGLGWVLFNQGRIAEAKPWLRKAVEVDPKYADGHNNLGWALQQEGDLDGAVAEFAEAVRIDPKHKFALLNQPRAERMRTLLGRLPDVLSGKSEPATPAEACDFARLCTQAFQGRYGAAVRMYEKAFAAEPKLAGTTQFTQTYRFSAACVAALAGRGEGIDAPLDPIERSALRGKALTWLRADLTLYRTQAASPNAAERNAVAGKLWHILGDQDFAALRPGLLRIGLPAAERAEWDKLWADVKTTISEANKPR